MARPLWHRWNAPEGRSPGAGLPVAGELVYGARNHWRVLEVRPVESRKHPNAWAARMQPLGPHGLSEREILDRCAWSTPAERVWHYAPWAHRDDDATSGGDTP